MRRLLFAMLICLTTGCASYTVPGGPAKIVDAKDTDGYLRSAYQAKPLATFPATVAVARVQSGDYESRTAQSYGEGSYRLITTHDVETDADFDRLTGMAGIRAIAPINRMLVPEQLRNEEDLQLAAARIKADMVLVYTFDTKFYVHDFATPVTIFTLGLSPTRRAYVTTTASAIFVDTRTGYVYGGAESTARSDQLANGWTTDDAIDDTRTRTERESFQKLLGEIEKSWPKIVKQYSTTQPTTMP